MENGGNNKEKNPPSRHGSRGKGEHRPQYRRKQQQQSRRGRGSKSHHHGRYRSNESNGEEQTNGNSAATGSALERGEQTKNALNNENRGDNGTYKQSPVAGETTSVFPKIEEIDEGATMGTTSDKDDEKSSSSPRPRGKKRTISLRNASGSPSAFHPFTSNSATVDERASHNLSRAQLHRNRRESRRRHYVAQCTIQFLDWLIFTCSELLKAFIREATMLVNKISDGIAASLLHLTFRPGYISGRRARITSRVSSTSGDSDSQRGKRHSSLAAGSIEYPGVSSRPFSDLLRQKFPSIWTQRDSQEGPSTSQSQSDSTPNSGNEQGTRTRRKTKRRTFCRKRQGFISSIFKRIEGVHQLLLPSMPTFSETWDSVVSRLKRIWSGSQETASEEQTAEQAGDTSNHQFSSDTHVLSSISSAKGSQAHLSKTISKSTGLFEELSVGMPVWIDSAGTFLRKKYRKFLTRLLASPRTKRNHVSESHRANAIYMWPFSCVHFLWKICKLILATFWKTLVEFLAMFRRYAGPGNVVNAFKISWRKLISQPAQLIFREVVGRLMWNSRFVKVREKAAEIAPNLNTEEDIRESDLPAVSSTQFTKDDSEVANAESTLKPARIGDTDVLGSPIPRSLQGTSTKLISSVYGFPVETYGVRTVDGYFLRLIRIPRPDSSKVAFFQHGLLDTATAWVANGHLFSLACRAYQMGADVFLANLRGTTDLMQHEFSNESTSVSSPKARERAGSDNSQIKRALKRYEHHTAAIPAHSKLSVLSREFWAYSVDDHVLDVFALTEKMHQIKYNEREQWKNNRQQVLAKNQSSKQLSVVGIGHSMGGAILIATILHSRALHRYHGFSKLVLLSPAAYHKYIAPPAKIIVKFCHWLLRLGSDGPFPMRSSYLESAFAKLLQDLKRTQATSDALATLMSSFFGGSEEDMPFRHVHLTEYPLGGSSRRVFLQGIHCMNVKDFSAYNFGSKENLKRYNSESAPFYREDYGLIDIPVHFVAGARDYLIPAENLLIQRDAINLVHPGRSTLRIFEDAGHLDFTLGLDDGIINHVLREINTVSPPASNEDDRTGIITEAEKRERMTRVSHVTEPEDLRPILNSGIYKTHSITKGPWRPAWVCAKDYPWLASYTKLEAAFEGLDQVAQEGKFRRIYLANLALSDDSAEGS